MMDFDGGSHVPYIIASLGACLTIFVWNIASPIYKWRKWKATKSQKD